MSITALLVGKSHCVAQALARSARLNKLFVISDFANPGLKQCATELVIASTKDPALVSQYAGRVSPDFAIIGSEEPLAAGVADVLENMGIPCVGPRRAAARIESSKAFTRALLDKYGIPGNPLYKIFRSMDGLERYLRTKRSFVIKPDGLTGGKGVKVFGEHFDSITQVLGYCSELFAAGHPAILVEEKLEGEEFSFQSFCDGEYVVHTIPVQDHKRAWEGDKGPNTGGMGSYSCADHLLPFLSEHHLQEAAEINRRVADAIRRETGQAYRGILYGGFMVTPSGLRVIEYNCRFGDPEVMNLLPLLETDFVDVCEAIIQGSLNTLGVRFLPKATVCKYIVPAGYPELSKTTGPAEIDLHDALQLPELGDRLRMHYAAVNEVDEHIVLTDSRSLAFVGIGDDLASAEQLAERAARSVKGPVYHRSDIGTKALVQKRVDHMNELLAYVPEKERMFAH